MTLETGILVTNRKQQIRVVGRKQEVEKNKHLLQNKRHGFLPIFSLER